MKKKLSTIFLIFIFLIGVSLLLYPAVSEYWNSRHQSQAIASYQEQVQNLETDRYEEIWNAAVAYNQDLQHRESAFFSNDAQKAEYENLLNVSGTGIMGYVEIPSIDVKLPIYHGTDHATLQVAVGHLEWSSLPVGGAGTHCVISGHRGLPSAKLFTNLDRMVEGDIFHLRVLDEVLTYQVDQILIVKPEELKPLLPEQGKDLCTLVTCTPYGINSHRLLIRGHRIDFAEESKAHVIADAVLIDAKIVALALATVFLLVLLMVIAVRKHKKK